MNKTVKRMLSTVLVVVLAFGMLLQNVAADSIPAASASAASAESTVSDSSVSTGETQSESVDEQVEEPEQIAADSSETVDAQTEVTPSASDASSENLTRGSPSAAGTDAVQTEEAGTALVGATGSSDLTSFLTQVTTSLAKGDDGKYTVTEGQQFDLTLAFSESETSQLNDTGSLTYTIPAGINLDGSTGTFPITISDEQGNATLEGNTYSVENGVLTVKLNQQDPNFSRLQALGNVSFGLNFKAKLDGKPDSVTFTDGTSFDFEYTDPTSDISTEKTGWVDQENGIIHYSVYITSTGRNTNVTAADTVSGTALIYQKDVTGQSSISGALSYAANNTDNGFTYVIPSMEDGEKVTLTYTAKVDYSKLSGSSATFDETNNTVKVTSTENPDGKEASKDFTNGITY